MCHAARTHGPRSLLRRGVSVLTAHPSGVGNEVLPRHGRWHFGPFPLPTVETGVFKVLDVPPLGTSDDACASKGRR